MQTKQANTFLFFFLLAVAFIVTVGCGGVQRPDGLPPTYPLSIKVLQEGKPLDDATVALYFADGSMTWTVGGVTDAGGIAKMYTHGKFEGVPEGNYNVTVSKMIYEGKTEYDAAMESGNTAAAQKIDVSAWQLVSNEYMLQSKTPIKIEVKKSTKTLEVDAGPTVRIKKEMLK
jgi:hypothetical protein